MKTTRFFSSLSRSNRLLIAAWLMLATIAGMWWRFGKPTGEPTRTAVHAPKEMLPGIGSHPVATPTVAPAPIRSGSLTASNSWSQWLQEFQRSTNSPTLTQPADRLREGLAVAEQRREYMKQLIRKNPRQALQEALRWDEYAALPEEIRQRVERPFSEAVEFLHLPVCGTGRGPQPAGTPDHITMVYLPDGTRAEAFTFGQRTTVMSKNRWPASGIVLDGVAALQETVFRPVLPVEQTEVQKRFALGQRDLQHSFATGQPIAGEPTLALAGNKLYAFADPQELQQMDHALAVWDTRPGPNAGASVLYYQALPAGTNGAFNLPAAERYVGEQASAWTETKKKMFLIRVDFADRAGEPVSWAAAYNEINGPSSDLMRDMSYGKTWIEAGVSTNVYRMPQTAAYYSGGSLNDEILRDARNTFRLQKSGADAVVNLGPTNNVGTGGDSGLGDYDIVAVFFAGIGMRSGSIEYAGLAGGGNLWVQDANYTSLYTHEFGHNYGVGHASFWQTSDGSVTGAGASEEYGDPFDLMGSGPAGPGHYHPQAKAVLNWITTNQWVDATAAGSGTFRIYNIDDPHTTNLLRGMRITKNATPGNQEYYWIGYRQAFNENAHLTQGAYFIWQRPAETRCWLLDSTPGSSDGKNDAPIVLGRTYSDTNAGVHITPLLTGGSGSEKYLDVRVNLGAFPGNQAPTAPGITGPTTVAARTVANYSVNASDLDNDPLAFYWDAQDGMVNSNNAAIARSWTVGGTYGLRVTASDLKGGVVTLSNTVTVTDPLDTWTASVSGTTVDLMEIVAGKGRLVAADYWGTVYLSWDGVGWTNVGAPLNFEREPRLAFGGGMFVLGGKQSGVSAGWLCYSPDGRIWSEAVFPAGVPQIRDVAYGGGQFIAVATSGTVLRSTNGVNWTSVTVPGLPDLRLITWDGTDWMAIAVKAGDSWPRQPWVSADGLTWNQGTALGFDAFEVCSFAGTLYALGWYSGVTYSTDHGTSWLNAYMPGTTQWTTHRMAAADDGTLLLIAEAMNESGTPRALLVSEDGRKWFRSRGDTNAAKANHLTFAAGNFVTVENGGNIRRSGSFHAANQPPMAGFTNLSATASARQPVYFAGTATDADGDLLHYAWDFGNQTLMQDGFEIAPTFAFGGTYNFTLRVSDGRGGLTVLTQSITINDPARFWTQRVSGVTKALNTVAASPDAVVAAGNEGTLLLSSNGISWMVHNVPEYAGNLYFHGATWDGTNFILVGVDYDFDLNGWVGVLYTSTNGVDWTRRYKSPTTGTDLSAVTSSGAISIAVGPSGTILRSTNGINWGAVSVSGIGTASLSGVAYGGGCFVLTGFTGGNGNVKVFTSSDGLGWLDYSSGPGLATWQDLRTVAWLNDRFVASGFYSKLMVSTNGAQTFSTTRLPTEEVPATAFGDGLWFAAGLKRDVVDSQVDVMSLDGRDWISFPAPTNTERRGAVFFKHTFLTVGVDGAIFQSGDISAPMGWPAWQAAHFPGGGLAALSHRDANGDGLPNVVKYALGRNPNLPAGSEGAKGKPQGGLNAGRFQVRLDMPEPAAQDVNYVISGATNITPVSWFTLARKDGTNAWQWLGGGTTQITTNAISGGRMPVVIGLPADTNGLPKYFLRFDIETP